MKTCKQCSQQFKTSAYESDDLCSRKCKAEYNKQVNSATKTCPMCNSLFTYDKRKPRVVCGRTCQHKYQTTEAVIQSSRSKIRQTLLAKYGVDHNSKVDGFLEKRKLTNLKKYGVEHFTNRDKAKRTLLERYGSTNFNNTKQAQETMRKRYGVTTFSQSPLFKEKLLKRYGVNHPLQTPKNRRRMYQKVIAKLKDVTPKFDFNDYTGVYTKVYDFECNHCHSTFQSSLDDGRIPICRTCHPITRTKSKCEYEIIEWIKTFYDGEIIHGDKSVLMGKELDIYLPSKQLAIEVNGLYYHGEISGNKNKQYHLTKTKQCSRNGISLVHVLDIEWIHKQEIVKSILSNKILPEDTRHLHGRKCTVKDISAEVSNNFLYNNHIQGEDNSSVRIGLFYKDELVSVLTFGKNRFNKETEWEMYRFCNKVNTNVRGGLEKMFSYFVKMYQPSGILSFSDRRYFTGQTYSKIGFTLVHITPPNYHYFKANDHTTIFASRNRFQKHKLKKILEVYDDKLTEWQNMQLNGYDRIWDCGSTKWIWYPKQVENSQSPQNEDTP